MKYTIPPQKTDFRASEILLPDQQLSKTLNGDKTQSAHPYEHSNNRSIHIKPRTPIEASVKRAYLSLRELTSEPLPIDVQRVQISTTSLFRPDFVLAITMAKEGSTHTGFIYPPGYAVSHTDYHILTGTINTELPDPSLATLSSIFARITGLGLLGCPVMDVTVSTFGNIARASVDVPAPIGIARVTTSMEMQEI